MAQGLFITGTNTEVGKTYVGCLVARHLVQLGIKLGVYKPVASGCHREDDRLVAEDALFLWEAAGRPGDFSRVCPQQFLAPLAPPRAAEAEGREVDSQLLREGLEYWKGQSEFVLVEGAGGLLSPISAEDSNASLAVDLGLPLLIVAANELGTINATLQTVVTARAVAPQLPIVGIILNQTSATTDDSSVKSNAEDIAARTNVPVLATLPYGESALPSNVDWRGRFGVVA